MNALSQTPPAKTKKKQKHTKETKKDAEKVTAAAEVSRDPNAYRTGHGQC
jgi:hypothetical protein